MWNDMSKQSKTYIWYFPHKFHKIQDLMMQYHYVENVHSYNDNNAWYGQWPSNNTADIIRNAFTIFTEQQQKIVLFN